jgi:phosphopantetheinyl transferase (holo-ACP synthase)
LREPDRHLLAAVVGNGLAVFHDTYSASPSRDYFSRRFLTASERASYLALIPSETRRWLAGRIAAKDAIRAWLWERGCGPLYPAEIEILTDTSGRLVAKSRVSENLHLAIASRDELSAAVVRDSGRAGVAIERIDGSHNAETSRMLAAQQAAANASESPSPSPKQAPVRELDGQRVQVGSVTVYTTRQGDYVIAWTA